jgi:hypothetical protein
MESKEMLMNQSSTLRPSSFKWPALCRISAIAILAGACTMGAAAQQPASQFLASATDKPLDLASAAGVAYSSSSADVASPVNTVDADHLMLAVGAELQPPPRRRYGRPRYNDNQHNPDGSAKWTFVVGVGMTAPVGNTFHYLNTNYGAQVGGGRNFNKNFSVLAQFDYDAFGFNGRTLFNQAAIYTFYNGAQVTGLDGNSHIWSFTVNPSYNLFQSDSLGAYIVVGAGFYHKVANFTLPANVCLDQFCQFQATQNQNIDHYTSNAPGFNGGFGLTYKAGRFSSEHLFVEARYVFIDNSQRIGITVANVNTPFGQSFTGTNEYPANSNRTTYTAYKAGIRF